MYDRVVVGLTTIPSRVQYLLPVVSALRDQTRVPDAIYVTVSKTSSKEGGISYPLRKISRVLKKAAGRLGSVLVLDEDYGPLTKLVGMWMHERSPRTLLITADDDQLYSRTFVETLLNGAERHPGAAVCLCGHVLGKPPFVWGFRCSRHDDNPAVRAVYLKPDTRVTVVSGWCGCAYPRGVLGEELPQRLERFRTGANRLPLLNRHDDLYISSWLFLRGVEKYVVAYEGKHRDEEMDHATQNALSSNDGTRTPVTMARHTKEWWNFSREMQAMGLLESDAVPWNKSVVFLSCTAGVAVLALVVFVLAIKLRK
jgi:hypothetical protein